MLMKLLMLLLNILSSMCVDNIMLRKTIKVYGNNKPWITSTLRKKMIVDEHSSYANKDPNYAEKQEELDSAINKAKLEYKVKVESLFNQNKN